MYRNNARSDKCQTRGKANCLPLCRAAKRTSQHGFCQYWTKFRPRQPRSYLGCPYFHWLKVFKTFNRLRSNYLRIIWSQKWEKKIIFNIFSCVYYQIKITFSPLFMRELLLTHYELNYFLLISLQIYLFNISNAQYCWVLD